MTLRDPGDRERKAKDFRPETHSSRGEKEKQIEVTGELAEVALAYGGGGGIPQRTVIATHMLDVPAETGG